MKKVEILSLRVHICTGKVLKAPHWHLLKRLPNIDHYTFINISQPSFFLMGDFVFVIFEISRAKPTNILTSNIQCFKHPFYCRDYWILCLKTIFVFSFFFLMTKHAMRPYNTRRSIVNNNLVPFLGEERFSILFKGLMHEKFSLIFWFLFFFCKWKCDAWL